MSSRRILIQDVPAEDPRPDAPFALALSAIAATADQGSISAAIDSVAPATIASIAQSPDPRPEIEHPPARHGLRVVAAGSARAPARPPHANAPERERGVGVAGLELGAARQSGRTSLARWEPDLLESGHGTQAGMARTNARGLLAIDAS